MSGYVRISQVISGYVLLEQFVRLVQINAR